MDFIGREVEFRILESECSNRGDLTPGDRSDATPIDMSRLI